MSNAKRRHRRRWKKAAHRRRREEKLDNRVRYWSYSMGANFARVLDRMLVAVLDAGAHAARTIDRSLTTELERKWREEDAL